MAVPAERPTVAKRVRGRFPMNTPVTAMGLDDDVLKSLTPRARELTKADLVKMWQGKEDDRTLALTVRDISSIRAAFGEQLGTKLPGGIAGGVISAGDVNCCCCCCPCCCAESVTPPVVAKAA